MRKPVAALSGHAASGKWTDGAWALAILVIGILSVLILSHLTQIGDDLNALEQIHTLDSRPGQTALATLPGHSDEVSPEHIAGHEILDKLHQDRVRFQKLYIYTIAAVCLSLIFLCGANIITRGLRKKSDGYAQGYREIEKCLNNVLQSAGEGIIICDEEGNILLANQRAARFLAISAEDLCGKNIKSLRDTNPAKILDPVFDDTGNFPAQTGTVYTEDKSAGTGHVIAAEITLTTFSASGNIFSTITIKDLREKRLQEQQQWEILTKLNKYKNRNRLLAEAIQASDIGITIADAAQADFPLIYLNKAFTDMTGYSAEAFTGSNCRFLQGPETNTDNVRAIRKALEAHESFQTELLNYKKDGTPFWNKLTLSPVFDARDELQAYIGIQEDVTDQKKAEHELKRQKDLLELSERTARLGHWTYNFESGELYWSSVIYAIHGLSPEAYTPEVDTAIEFYHPEDREKIRRTLEKCVENGTNFETRARLIKPGGDIVNVYTHGHAEKDGDGKVISVFGIFQDISSNLKMAQDLLQEQDFNRFVIDYTPNLIVGLDAQGNTLFLNQYAADVIKTEKEDMVGRNWLTTFYPEMEEEMDALLERFARGEDVTGYELTMNDKGGEPHTICWSTKNKYDPNGKLEMIIGFGTDLTLERRNAQRERERQKLESLGTLAGGVAHEINNALVPIMLLSEHYRELYKDQSEDVIGDFDTIVEYTRHARDIVRDMLMYARRSTSHATALPAGETILNAIEFSQKFLPPTISVETDINISPEGRHFFADKTGFTQIMTNLLNNASHAMDQRGTIRIEADCSTFPDPRNREAALRIRIRDEGAGIPEDIVDKIFDPFFTTKSEGEGSGLGLSVVYGLIKEWDGEIIISSEEGKGTTFELLFQTA